MIRDRRFALVFRVVALLVAAFGFAEPVGVFVGEFSTYALMTYTYQSSLLAAVMFAILVVRTARGLREGRRGDVSWYARFRLMVVVALLVVWYVRGRMSGQPREQAR